MDREEINNIIENNEKLKEECKKIAKMYLDIHNGSPGYGYPGFVNSINLGKEEFGFNFMPSTSGIGGSGSLSYDYLLNGGEGLKKKSEERKEKARQERENRTCKTCGHEHQVQVYGSFVNPDYTIT